MGAQSFINKSFEKIISTDHALRLLHQFEYILNRDSLKVHALPYDHSPLQDGAGQLHLLLLLQMDNDQV